MTYSGRSGAAAFTPASPAALGPLNAAAVRSRPSQPNRAAEPAEIEEEPGIIVRPQAPPNVPTGR